MNIKFYKRCFYFKFTWCPKLYWFINDGCGGGGGARFIIGFCIFDESVYLENRERDWMREKENDYLPLN